MYLFLNIQLKINVANAMLSDDGLIHGVLSLLGIWLRVCSRILSFYQDDNDKTMSIKLQ